MTGTARHSETNAKLQIYTLAESITKGCSTDREKVKAVHDWLVKNVKYDYDNGFENWDVDEFRYDTSLESLIERIDGGYGITDVNLSVA